MLSAAFEKRLFDGELRKCRLHKHLQAPAPVLSRRANMRRPHGLEASPRIPRVGWDDDFMNLPPICLSDSGQNNAKNMGYA